MTLQVEYKDVIEAMNNSGHITVITGKRGGGKSAQGFGVIEELHNLGDYPVYVVGFPEEAEKLLPNYMKIVSTIMDVPNGSVVFIDEAAIHYSSKKWYDKEHDWLTKLLEIARHKNLILVFVTLNTASVDVNVLRFIDTLIVKQTSLLQEDLERPQLKKLIAVAKDAFLEIPKKEDPRAYSYVKGDTVEGLVKSPLPSFWSDELSKSYKAYDVSEGGDDEVPIIMGGDGPGGGGWRCGDCISYHEDDTGGWCDLGMNDVPRKRCDVYRKKSNKPKHILKSDKKRKNPPLPNPPEPNPPLPTNEIATSMVNIASEAIKHIPYITKKDGYYLVDYQNRKYLVENGIVYTMTIQPIGWAIEQNETIVNAILSAMEEET